MKDGNERSEVETGTNWLIGELDADIVPARRAGFRLHKHGDETPLIEGTGLAVGYGQRAILPPIDFRLRAGEFWALIGRNASGKTTLVRTLLGLLSPVKGKVKRSSGLRTGYVPQREIIDPDLPARAVDVVRGGLDSGWSFLNPMHVRRHRRAFEDVCRQLDLKELLRQPFSELSEGQKQRVLMGRALVSEPHVLVLDEPTSAMDIVAERDIFRLIDGIREERNIGIVVVSHHLALVASYATDVLFVDREDGTALAGCIADVAREPAFTRRFSAFDCGLHEHTHVDEHSACGGAQRSRTPGPEADIELASAQVAEDDTGAAHAPVLDSDSAHG